ncbi:MAG TPA: SAM-dependent chlorinase/fluorinase [Flavipsychrobacter sp.]|nr:SAM-dependent chlorinase/fluorinase [Flavipsychrobacter sp.]
MNCITLLSDFGLHDASVAKTKGLLMQKLPEVPILDISHLTAPGHLQQAAYLLASSCDSFPVGCCHIVLCNVFHEKETTMLLCEKNGQYFLAPDNGVLSLAFEGGMDKVWNCHRLKAEDGFRNWVHKAGEVVAAIRDKPAMDTSFSPCELKNAPSHWLPKIDPNTVECHVIHIDRFENVVLNITQKQFEKIGRNRNFRIQFTRSEEITTISKHYTDVKEGEKLCRFNSSGYLEIAINGQNAASLFGLELHSPKHVIYNTIKISFE